MAHLLQECPLSGKTTSMESGVRGGAAADCRSAGDGGGGVAPAIGLEARSRSTPLCVGIDHAVDPARDGRGSADAALRGRSARQLCVSSLQLQQGLSTGGLRL